MISRESGFSMDPEFNYDPATELVRACGEFEAYFEGAKPGSPRVVALADILALDQAQVRVYNFREYPRDSDVKPSHLPPRFVLRSELRIAEAVLVGIELRIQERSAGIPGYFIHQKKIRDWEQEIDALRSDKIADIKEEEIEDETLSEYFEQTLNRLLLQE